MGDEPLGSKTRFGQIPVSWLSMAVHGVESPTGPLPPFVTLIPAASQSQSGREILLILMETAGGGFKKRPLRSLLAVAVSASHEF